MASWFKSMGKKEKGKRQKDLLTDTSLALSHYHFRKLRQGSGGTYFLNFQQIMEKLGINKTKLMLKLNADVWNMNVNIGHECDQCGYLLDDENAEVFDSLSELEEKVCKETMMSLVHIARYVTRKDALLKKSYLIRQHFITADRGIR